MKTTLNVLAIVFLALGLVFTILPLGTIAFLPLILALAASVASLLITKCGSKKMAQWLLAVTLAMSVAVVVKNFAFKDKVAPETEAEQQQQEQSEQENLKDLEGL